MESEKLDHTFNNDIKMYIFPLCNIFSKCFIDPVLNPVDPLPILPDASDPNNLVQFSELILQKIDQKFEAVKEHIDAKFELLKNDIDGKLNHLKE